jgi:hypothetical protein
MARVLGERSGAGTDRDDCGARSAGTLGARVLATLLLATLLASFPSSVAHAHLGHVILRAERYLKLDVAGHRARVVVSLTLGDDEGGRILAAADTDGDGEVTDLERDAYLAQWAEGLRTELPVSVDGQPIELAWGEGWLEPTGRVRRTAVTVEMVAVLELAGGEQTVTIEDRMVRRAVFDRTDVAFRTRDGAELLASGAGEAPTEAIEDFTYAADFREGQPVELRAILRTPAPEPELPWPWIAAAAALAILAGTAFVVRRARRFG